MLLNFYSYNIIAVDYGSSTASVAVGFDSEANVQSPIPIISSSPTPIPQIYKAKVQTNV